MNILPKKRWHVRTRENIARVRRDEAAAAENEKARRNRVEKAETEARINSLREKTRARYDGRNEDLIDNKINVEINKNEHVNFFADLEDGKIDHHKPNAEHEAEIKAEKEKYEQQIGYLTYLGQNINATSSKSWYDELPRRVIDNEPNIEIQESKKNNADPIKDIKRYVSIMKSPDTKNIDTNIKTLKHSTKRNLESNDSDDEPKKRKKNKEKSKKHKSSKHKRLKSPETHNSHNINIEKLRNERLLREQKEKLRTDALLAKCRGETIPTIKTEEPKIIVHQKYNSQFCPEIARQNKEKQRR